MRVKERNEIEERRRIEKITDLTIFVLETIVFLVREDILIHQELILELI